MDYRCVITEKGELAYLGKRDIVSSNCLSMSKKRALISSLDWFEKNADFPKTDVHFTEENMILKFD